MLDELNVSRHGRIETEGLVLHVVSEKQHDDSQVHILREGIRCDTEKRGFNTPRDLSLTELVLHAPTGFIPLWAPNTTLHWRFQERSLRAFTNRAQVESYVRGILAEALIKWGSAAPVKFAERAEKWDFEVVVRSSKNCNPMGCVLASAFFPDAGQHELVIYPSMFEQDRKEQIDTLCHEVGHIFGLRHFFAPEREKGVPSVVFGKQEEFTIMNYGDMGELTELDQRDLAQLYQEVWSGRLTEINGTKIRIVEPFHLSGAVTIRREETLLAAASAPVIATAVPSGKTQ